MPHALVFEIGGQRLALPQEGRREVLKRGPVVLLPHGGPFLLGLTALRGQAVPLLDLAALLGCPAPAGPLVVLAELASEVVAWPVDAVEGVVQVPPAAPDPAPVGEAPQPGAARPVNLPALVQHLRRALQAP